MKLFPIFSMFLLLSLFQSACGTGKHGANNGQCTQTGTVKDFAGLDGCGILIILENGQKLLPISLPDENVALKDGQKIRLDFKEAEAMSICMAEDMMVEITCLEVLDTPKAALSECQEITIPMSVDWMKNSISKYKPAQVISYPSRNMEWIYLFKGNGVQLFDCRGVMICDSKGSTSELCMNRIPQDVRGRIIWQDEWMKD